MRIELNKEYLDRLLDFIEQQADDDAYAMVQDLHPADIADLFEEINIEQAKYLFLLFSADLAAEVIVELEEDERDKLLSVIPNEVIANQFISKMESDDAADILGFFDDERAQEILSHLKDYEQAGDIVDLLNYDEDTAGGIMAKELISVNENFTVKQALAEMRENASEVEDVYYIYVVDDRNILKGIVSLKNILFSSTNNMVKNLMDVDVIFVKTDTPNDEVARIMEKYDLVALPVVDGIGRLVGRITIDDVIDIIREESEQDYQLLSGITQDVDFSDSVFKLSKSRIPWLLIGMFGGICASLILGVYEGNIAKYAELALFLPLVAAMGGNAGVQSSAIVVQGLASGDLDLSSIGKKIFKELRVGLLNGLVCGLVIFAYNFFFSDTFALTITVSLALFSVIVFATVFGTFVPLMLNRFNIDPAIATGPFITTSNDIFGLFTYMVIAQMIFF